MTQSQESGGVLSAPLVIEYPFSRTTGPAVGTFLTGLREGLLVGVKGADGRVLVPPVEYDPVTAADLDEFVPVGPGGTVTTWSWVHQPHEKHPYDHPFAWALVQPDGADTPLLSTVDAGSIEAMATGMRVVARFRPEDERQGEIGDLLGFVPAEGDVPATPADLGALDGVEQVRSVRTPARLDYEFTAGEATSRFLAGIMDKKILGERCPVCGKVYVPPRGACPRDGVPTSEQVDLPHVGTVTSFCVVNVQFYGSVMEIPYVSANILLDGSDLPIMHLIQEVPADQVRMGMRVEAVWVPDDEIAPTLESIKWFRPTGEPDVEVRIGGEGYGTGFGSWVDGKAPTEAVVETSDAAAVAAAIAAEREEEV